MAFSWNMAITCFGVLVKFSQLRFILDLQDILYFEGIFIAHSGCLHKYPDKISWVFPDCSLNISGDQPQFKQGVYSHKCLVYLKHIEGYHIHYILSRDSNMQCMVKVCFKSLCTNSRFLYNFFNISSIFVIFSLF